MPKPIYALTYSVTVYTTEQRLQENDFRFIAKACQDRDAVWLPVLETVKVLDNENAKRDAKCIYLLNKDKPVTKGLTYHLELIADFLDGCL